MGVTGLDHFARKTLPNGCFPVDIVREIRKRKPCTTTTLVMDFQSLFEPACRPDLAGVLCGGRYELAYGVFEAFLKRLDELRVRVVFFNDGIFKKRKDQELWNVRHGKNYEREIEVMEDVDRGVDLQTLVKQHYWKIPCDTLYPLKVLAKRYGEFRIAVAGETKKEMVAYANSVNALAIVSNNSDLMIFRGGWRFWSSKDLNFAKLTTREFNRVALRRHLGLDEAQLARFATLASNNGFIRGEELEAFNRRHSFNPYELQVLAGFVRKPHSNLLVEAFGPQATEGDLEERFQKSLDYYGSDTIEQEQPQSDDPMLEFFKDLGKTFLFKTWNGIPCNYAFSFIDLRDDGFGSEFPNLLKKILLREAGILLYHRRNDPEHQTRKLILKPSHEAPYAEQTIDLEFPTHLNPPTLEDLLSPNPETHANLTDTKLQLYAWIISDTLTHDQLKSVPPKLMPTLATIYFLVEHQLIELFEADLLLQVAQDIVTKSYNLQNIQYPKHLDPRAFRLAFLYRGVGQQVLKALNVVGLDSWQQYPTYPQFDGVRFHGLYRKWAGGERDLRKIEQWRIYKDIF